MIEVLVAIVTMDELNSKLKIRAASYFHLFRLILLTFLIASKQLRSWPITIYFL